MGLEIQVNSLEEMCDLMCNNKLPKKKGSGKHERNKKRYVAESKKKNSAAETESFN